MAAISADDIDRNIVTFCFEVDTRKTGFGSTAHIQRMLPWAFVRFPDSGDPRYVAPVSGQQSVGLHAVGAQPYILHYEYMRNSPFPHEQDFGQLSDADAAKAGPRAVHFFGNV